MKFGNKPQGRSRITQKFHPSGIFACSFEAGLIENRFPIHVYKLLDWFQTWLIMQARSLQRSAPVPAHVFQHFSPYSSNGIYYDSNPQTFDGNDLPNCTQNKMGSLTATLISTPEELQELLDHIPPRCTIYLDVEEDNDSRHGHISLITILVHQLQEINIIDVLSLRELTFSTVSESGTTLQSVLEDRTITKCLWDVRNAAHALWTHFGVDLAGVIDVQLLENASRHTGTDKEFLCERDRAVRVDLSPVVRLTSVRPDRYGSKASHKYSAHRGAAETLESESLLSCARGVLHLRGLRDVYMRRISIAWLAKVRDESARRVYEAQSQDYEPQSPVMNIRGPWKARLGTVGMAPAMLERRGLDRPAEKGILKVSRLEKKEQVVEKKRSRIFSWKGTAQAVLNRQERQEYQNFESSADGWWD